MSSLAIARLRRSTDRLAMFRNISCMQLMTSFLTRQDNRPIGDGRTAGKDSMDRGKDRLGLRKWLSTGSRLLI